MLRMLAAMPRGTHGRKDGEAGRTGYATRFELPCNLATVITPAEFVGGQDVFLRWFYSEWKKRDASRYRGKTIKVLARFVVRADGSIDDVEIVKPGRAMIDAAVGDILSPMPAWKPATVDGQPVSVRYTLPLRFGNK